MPLPGDLAIVENRYLFGDGSKNNSKRRVINHTYNDVCINCITEVYVIAKEHLYYYYYAKDIQNISVIGKDCCFLLQSTVIIFIIEPVTVNNSNTSVNNGKKLYKEYSATLRLFSNGT